MVLLSFITAETTLLPFPLLRVVKERCRTAANRWRKWKAGNFFVLLVFKKAKFLNGFKRSKKIRKNGLRSSENQWIRNLVVVQNSMEMLCAEIFANGLRIKKIRFTHFGKLNLLLLRKTQNHFYWLFGLLEALLSADHWPFQIGGFFNDAQNKSETWQYQKLF